jgi:hypothetical protein
MRRIVCLMLLAGITAGCGGGENAMRQATDADTAGLPQSERNHIACLRKAGIHVRVPSDLRRLVKGGEHTRRIPHGVEGRRNLLFFYLFDKRQRLTKEQLVAARRCDQVR